MCPLRSCDKQFLAKSVNVYTVRLGGVEEEMTAAELKEARARGEEWEKVYTYRLGGERRQLTPSEAEEWEGCKRQGKTPVQASRYLNDWNDKENAERWRAAWAALQNGFLSKAESEARVDHRSYADRGIERVATRHEGPYVNKLEKEAAARAAREGVAYGQAARDRPPPREHRHRGAQPRARGAAPRDRRRLPRHRGRG